MPLMADIAMLMKIVSGVKSSPKNLRDTVISLIINREINETGAHMKSNILGAIEAHIKIKTAIIDPSVLLANVPISKSSFGETMILIKALIVARKINKYAKVNGKLTALCVNKAHNSFMMSLLSNRSVEYTLIYPAMMFFGA